MMRQPALFSKIATAFVLLLVPLIIATQLQPAWADASVELAFGGDGVWPSDASSNSERYFRATISWDAASESIYDLWIDVEGSWRVWICRNGVWADTSEGVAYYVPDTGSWTPPDQMNTDIGSVIVTVGPYVGDDIYGRWHGAGPDGIPLTADDTAVGRLRTWTYYHPRWAFTFGGVWANWETDSDTGAKIGPDPDTPFEDISAVSGSYGNVPDDDDMLEWYSGDAAGVDPLTVDTDGPDYENGSGSNTYTFKVMYRAGYHTRDFTNLMPRFNRDGESIPGPFGTRVIMDGGGAWVRDDDDSGMDFWLLGRSPDPWFDNVGYWGTLFRTPGVCLIIDGDYAHPHIMVKEDPSDSTYTDGVIYKYVLRPTDFKNLLDNLFGLPYDQVGEDPWDSLNTAIAGQPLSNNYVVLSAGGHVYEFIATDDFSPHLDQGWINIGRPGNSEQYAYITSNGMGGFNPPTIVGQRFSDNGAGGFGYPYDSQDTSRYPKIDPVLSAHPYFPHRTATSNPYPGGVGSLTGVWPDGTLTGPDIPGALANPFDITNDGGPIVSGVEAGYGDPDINGAGKGESTLRFINDCTIAPNLANIYPDDDPTSPLSGGKWTQTTNFKFRINYWQSDNIQPLLIQVRIRKATGPTSGGAWQAYTLSAADPGDTDVTDGKVFQIELSPTQLPGGGGPGDYHYYFLASDGINTTIFPRRPGDPTVGASSVANLAYWGLWVPAGGGNPVDPGDPGVPGGADWYWFRVNSAPELSDHSVTPASGRRNQNFIYRVRYTDVDGVADPDWTQPPTGDKPFRAYLYIDLFGDVQGEATVTSVSSETVLVYSVPDGPGYADNSLVGYTLEMLSGNAVNNVYPIVANTATTITVTGTLITDGVAGGDRFNIANWYRASMQPENPSDTDYTDGAFYVLDTATLVNLEPGVHRYYFEFTDDWGAWLYPNESNVSVEGETVRYPSTGSFVGPPTRPITTERLQPSSCCTSPTPILTTIRPP